MTMLGRQIAGERSDASLTTCSASHLVCSYVLRNVCPASSWRSRNVPAKAPATYAVETWTKRSMRPSAFASRAKPITSRVPSTLISRASSKGRSNEIEAAQCSTAPASSATAARSPLGSPSPGFVTSPGIARASSRYGDGSFHSLASTPSRRSWAATASGARTSASTSRSPFSSRRAITSMPRNPVAPVRNTGAFTASPPGELPPGRLLPATRARGASRRPSSLDPLGDGRERRAHRVEPAVDVDDLRRDRARGVGQQEVDRLRDRARVVDVPAERRLTLPPVGKVAEAWDAARGERPERAGGNQVHAHLARAEVAREVARGSLQRGLGDAHPVVDRPGHGRVEVQPDDRRALLRIQVRQADGERLQ